MLAAGRSFELPEGRALKVAVVADTHSHPHPNAPGHLRTLAPDLILHAGDIGSADVLRTLESIAPLLAIRGNIDEPGLPDELCIDFRQGDRLALRILLTHIAVYGPRLRADVRKRALAQEAQLVVCGHSHVPLIARDGALAIFNPGSVGPRRFQLPITFGLIEVGEGRVSLSHLAAETGAKWQPPAGPM